MKEGLSENGMDTYLVTGGAGFIGSHLVAALVERGHTVRVLDNFSTGRAANLPTSAAELFEGDLRDADVVRQAMRGVTVVLHQAALPSVQRSVEDPLATNAACVTGTLNVLLAARDAGVRRVVVASSSSVYGDSPTLPKVETMAPAPLSPYAAAKLATESYALAFAASYGLPAIALRYFNVYGPRQDPHSDYAAVIPRFITRMLRGEQPLIFGDGRQSRDFTYVQDVVAANLLAAAAPADVTGVFNAAAGARYTLLDLVDMLNRLLGTDLQPEHRPARAGEVRHSQADVTAIREALGFFARTTFEEGLAKTIAAFRM
jgi:UDP-glucose 4-epimerase